MAAPPDAPPALDSALRPPLWQRGAAFLLDAGLVALFVAASQWGFRLLFPELDARLDSGADLYRWHVLSLSVPVWAYFIAAEAGWRKTLGKTLLRLEVREVGRAGLSTAAALRRNVVKLLPFELVHVGLLVPEPLWQVEDPGFRGVLMAGFVLMGVWTSWLVRSPARQGLWDRAAGTYVQRRG